MADKKIPTIPEQFLYTDGGVDYYLIPSRRKGKRNHDHMDASSLATPKSIYACSEGDRILPIR